MANVSLKGEGNVTLYYVMLQILNGEKERRRENNDTESERDLETREREREARSEHLYL